MSDKDTMEARISELEEQIKALQHIVILAFKGGCSRAFLDAKISQMEGFFYENKD